MKAFFMHDVQQQGKEVIVVTFCVVPVFYWIDIAIENTPLSTISYLHCILKVSSIRIVYQCWCIQTSFSSLWRTTTLKGRRIARKNSRFDSYMYGGLMKWWLLNFMHIDDVNMNIYRLSLIIRKRLIRYGESEKSNRVEMTNDNLLIAILPMTTMTIPCQFP